jgi:propanol-preferring alcohol dehydrogenase
MKAMILKKISPIEKEPLEMVDLAVPVPRPREVLVKVSACGVCHTELDEIEGRIQPKLPIVLGHEIVGRVERLGSQARKFNLGDRV